MTKVTIYCAVSMDGFIAGPDDDLSWLGEPLPNNQSEPGTIDFPTFMTQTGAILMGRRTFDVVIGLGDNWPYGATPVMVATSRPLVNAPETVSTCAGNIRQLCQQARKLAGERNVYLDGGQLISQALDAECVDEMILTVVPILLGQGVRLYQGRQQHRFDAEPLGQMGRMMQMKLAKPTRVRTNASEVLP